MTIQYNYIGRLTVQEMKVILSNECCFCLKLKDLCSQKLSNMTTVEPDDPFGPEIEVLVAFEMQCRLLADFRKVHFKSTPDPAYNLLYYYSNFDTWFQL